MKVLQINAIYGAKSTGVIMRDIHELLQSQKQKSYVVAPEFASVPKDSYKIGNYIDYKIHALMTRVTGMQAYFSRLATKKLIKYMKIIKPDIVHVHNLHGNFINFNMLMNYLYINDISLVITMHDCWYFTGKCFHYIEDGCLKWQSECYKCVRKRKDVPNWFFDRVTKVHRDKKKYITQIKDVTVVGPSQWICNEAKKSFLSSTNIKCIYNGVDTDIFKSGNQVFRKTHHLENKFIIMGMANKWLDEKNCGLVRKIISVLQPDDLVVLIGTEEKDLTFDTDRIIAIPYVENRQELADLYDSADVFVNLTLADTFPTVNMEAICCGTPVITHDVGGCRETIDEHTGILVSIGDTDNLIKAIQTVKDGCYCKCAEIGAKKFSKSKNYEKYMEMYYEIEKRRKSKDENN